MKAYILSERDLNELLGVIDRDPAFGFDGGSSVVMNEEQRRLYEEAHSFYNHQIRKWINSVKKD